MRICAWTSGNFHVAWQGNFEQWVADPTHVRQLLTFGIPHFGQPVEAAFTHVKGGASGPVNIATSGVYQWWYTVGFTFKSELYVGSVF
jgi:photosystem I P700 chlorophyll a apoprotein A2